MKLGEERELIIPAEEGYGANGFPAWGIVYTIFSKNLTSKSKANSHNFQSFFVKLVYCND